MGLWWWWRKFSNKVNPFLLGAHGHLFKTISPCATHSEKLFFVVIFNRNLLKGSKKIFGHLLRSLYSSFSDFFLPTIVSVLSPNCQFADSPQFELFLFLLNLFFQDIVLFMQKHCLLLHLFVVYSREWCFCFSLSFPFSKIMRSSCKNIVCFYIYVFLLFIPENLFFFVFPSPFQIEPAAPSLCLPGNFPPGYSCKNRFEIFKLFITKIYIFISTF